MLINGRFGIPALLALVLAGGWSRPAPAETAAAAVFADAEAKLHRDEFKDALQRYRDFVAKFPEDKRCPQARYAIAFVLHKKLGLLADARVAYEDVITYHPTSPLANDAQFHIAESYEQAGDEQKALGVYEDFLKKEPDNPRAKLVKRRIEALRNKAHGGKKTFKNP